MKEISYKEAINFLLPRHYSGRKPQIKYAFGWYVNGVLKAVCTFGKPASNSLCKGILGEEFSSNVYELNRLCREDDFKEPLSKFVSWCLRQLNKEDLIIVSYADKQMNHSGYIYQACNFIYTGATKERTDKYTENNKHSRHYSKEQDNSLRKFRSSKHRYVYFCTNNKYLKREWLSNLKYKIEPYPKEENKNYILGEYLKTKIINNSLAQ
jgi:hypothetical protein